MGDLLAHEFDLSAVRSQKMVDETPVCTFSTADSPNDGESLSFVYVKADVIHRMDKFIRFPRIVLPHREGFDTCFKESNGSINYPSFSSV